jgi:hypothetical protein
MVKKWLKCGFALKKSGFEHGKKGGTGLLPA